MRRPRFLIIDDERNFREFLAEALEVEGYGVTQAATARAGLALARQELPQIVLLDQNLPDGSGLDLIHDLRALPSNPVIIMITAFAGYDNAVRAVKAGAFHYLNKPFGFPDLLDVVAEACVAFPALGELGELEMLGALVGAHPRMEQVKQRIARIARTPVSTVLIRGESGTGKEVAARALHERGPRKAPLIGKVVRVEDKEVGVEVATGVTVKVVKSMIAEVRSRGEPAPANDSKS